MRLIFIFLTITFFSCSKSTTSPYKEEALSKIKVLEDMMKEARSQSIDVTREEALLWFSNEFLKFADWDEANMEQVEKSFGYYRFWADEKEKYARELPDFERKKVIEMLDVSIAELEKIIDGEIFRPPVRKVQWGDIVVQEDLLLSNGKPVFLHDYFSKTVGQPLTNEKVYNDHLGKIYHGGENLYEEHQDRAINPWLLNEDGTFNQEKIKLITDIEDTSVGFLYFWNSGLPEWLLEKDSTIQKGRSLFLGMDIDNPLVRDHWGKIARKAGELTRGKKVTQLGYVLANEPHWFAEKGYWTQNFGEMNSISDYTLNKFRNWLSASYKGNIQGLNANWESSYQDFNSVEIEIPMDKSHRGKPMWYDWCRFSMERTLDWFSYIQSEVKSTNPEAKTEVKLMPRYFWEDYRSHGLDFEALTELMDIIGDDARADGGRRYTSTGPEPWEERYAFFWGETAFSYDFMESVAPNKLHVNSETHFISTGAWRDLNTSVDYTRSIFWLATLHGMDAGITWFWARDPDGSPEDRLEGDLDFWDPGLGGAYAGSLNMQPQTANEIAQVYYDMNSVSEELYALRTQRRPLRIFYSETSAINKKKHATDLFGLYESLYFEGLHLGYATEKIIKKQDNSSWDAIVVYKTPYITDEEFEAVQSYLNNGGTVFIDAESLKKDEYGKTRNMELKPAAGKIIEVDSGISLEELRAQIFEQFPGLLPDVRLTESNGTDYKGCTWRVVDNGDSGYWVNILNIGKNDAVLSLGLKDGRKANVINMLTGEELGAEFDLKQKGVLLLEIK